MLYIFSKGLISYEEWTKETGENDRKKGLFQESAGHILGKVRLPEKRLRKIDH